MIKSKDRRFKDLSGRRTVEEIIERRMRADKGKLRGQVRAKQRAKKFIFIR